MQMPTRRLGVVDIRSLAKGSATMTNRKHAWRAFTHDPGFHYPGSALQANWRSLHRCDCEAYPSEASLAVRLQADAQEQPTADVVAGVQDAWRAYHCGDFKRAFDLGTQAGLSGFAVAVKAAGLYASQLETDATRARALLLDAAQRAEDAAARLPSDVNAHYLLAFTLGRYCQRISVIEALASGHVTTIKQSLQRSLKLQPRHCEAHIAMGLYHAELIGKVGALVAGISHGASRDRAVEHFKQALKLGSKLPAPSLEYANGLRSMGDGDAAEIEKLLRYALHCQPHDAATWLDVEAARKQLP
jgi:hypothetical protein